MTVTKETATALDTFDVQRKASIDATDYTAMIQRVNANYERMYDEAAPGAGGKTITEQNHDANGNGKGIRRGGCGSWYIPGGGTSWTGSNVYTYTLSATGHCWVSPGIEKITVIALVDADSVARKPYMRVKATEDGASTSTYSSDDGGDGAWTEIAADPAWYYMTVPVATSPPNLTDHDLEIEIKLDDTDGSTNTTIYLYAALPIEHADEGAPEKS